MKKITFLYLIFLTSISYGQNLLNNGDFASGTANWTGNNFSVVAGEAFISSTNFGGNLWDTQLVQAGMTFPASTTYTLSFDARSATVNRTVEVAIQNVGSWQDQFRLNYNITTSMQTFTAVFTSLGATNTNVQIGFLMAGQGSTDGVYFDNVSIVPGGVAGPTPPSAPTGFVAPQPSFNTFESIYLAVGPNNVGSNNIVYKLFYYPTASAPASPLNGTEYIFGSTPGDGNGTAAFGFSLSGLNASTQYTFCLYQYNTVTELYSSPSCISGPGTNTTTLAQPVFPTTNAPNPTCPVGDVVSIYGGFYANNIATNYNPNWGQSGFAFVNPNYDPGTGNLVLAYPNFNYQGTNVITTDLSNMEFLNFDVFTGANPATTTLQVSPINQGTGPAEILVTVPFVQGEWTSISLPKSAFGGMTWDAVFQMKFAANGPGSTVPIDLFLDNIFFSGDCQIVAPINDQPCGALSITSAGQTDLNTYAFLADMTCNNSIGNNESTSPSLVGASCGGTYGRSLWYTFTTPSCDLNGMVPFEIEFSTNNAGTNFNTKLAIFESDDNDCNGVFTELACNDDHNGAGNPALCDAAGMTTSTIVTNLQPNKQYWVYVDGFDAEFGDFVLSGRALTPAHGAIATSGGTQIQLSTADMGAGLYTYYYKQVGSTGHSTSNSQTSLTNIRTLAPGNDYITQIMYRCDASNFVNQNQFYRTEPQTITLENQCALVNDMTCTFNGPNSYTLTWTEPTGDLFTNDGALSGYRIKRNPVGSTGVYTFSNPAVVCSGGTCSVTLPGNSPTGFNWTIETRCSANSIQVGNTTSCGPAPEMTLDNDGNNNIDRSAGDVFSFVNAEAGIEFVDVQMFDAYADFGLNTPMIGDYEIFVNDNNEISWRRVGTPVNANFDFVIVPNPSNAMTTVFLNTIVEEGSFTIVDAMGRTIQTGSINNTDNVNFDAAQLQSGVYMVVVTVGNQKMTRRLVVAN